LVIRDHRLGAEGRLGLRPPLRRVPSLGCLARCPVVDPAAAGIAVEIVLAQETLSGKRAEGRCRLRLGGNGSARVRRGIGICTTAMIMWRLSGGDRIEGTS